MTEYTIITGAHAVREIFEQEVSERLVNGWELAGGIAIWQDVLYDMTRQDSSNVIRSDTRYAQALTRERRERIPQGHPYPAPSEEHPWDTVERRSGNERRQNEPIVGQVSGQRYGQDRRIQNDPIPLHDKRESSRRIADRQAGEDSMGEPGQVECRNGPISRRLEDQPGEVPETGRHDEVARYAVNATGRPSHDETGGGCRIQTSGEKTRR